MELIVSYLYNGDCLVVMFKFVFEFVDCIVMDLFYFVNFCDCSGCLIVNDVNGDWLVLVFVEMFCVLKCDVVCILFYGWNKVDLFFDVWKVVGFCVVGYFVFMKFYVFKVGLVKY